SLIHVILGSLEGPVALQPYRVRQVPALRERLREFQITSVAIASELQGAVAELIDEGHVLLSGAYHGIDDRLRVCRGHANRILCRSCRFVHLMLKGGGHPFACFHEVVGSPPDTSRSVRPSLPCFFRMTCDSLLRTSRHSLLLRR